MLERFRGDRLRRVLGTIDELLQGAAAAVDARHETIANVLPARRASAENLAHYLAVRARDLRPLQRELHDLSLSSLGRMEGHVAGTLHGVRHALRALLGEAGHEDDAEPGPVLSGDENDQLLAVHAEELLGPCPSGRQTRVMVTLGSTMAHDEGMLADLLRAGMDTARINLAHDTPETWTALATNLRTAAQAVGRPCRVLADLPGPKLRTGALEPGPEVVRVRPKRDVYGIVTKPAQVVFRDPQAVPPECGPDTIVVPLAASLVCFAEVGDEFVVTDTRSRQRCFTVLRVDGPICTAVVDRTAYLGTGCTVSLRRGITTLAQTRIGTLPALESFVPLQENDILVLTRDQTPGRPARTGPDGRVEPARIPCAMPEVFDDARPDQRILFDDGKIAGIVVAQERDALSVRITVTPPGGARLRAGKGINLPDTELRAPAFDREDEVFLDWAIRNADLVGMSFVQRPSDVMRMQAELRTRGRPNLGILLKIETAVAFQRLPELLFAGLHTPLLGVMVARGDLAVEVGYARLAEVQEEILWLCEAAHVPVVWATQVLDSMARTGIPSRAEVTDAAMGVRAECVMLNKGQHIVETVQFLGGVLERMQTHHVKKRSLMRRLHVAGSPPTVGGTRG